MESGKVVNTGKVVLKEQRLAEIAFSEGKTVIVVGKGPGHGAILKNACNEGVEIIKEALERLAPFFSTFSTQLGNQNEHLLTLLSLKSLEQSQI